MKRRIAGLHEAALSAADEIRNGVFLVRVERAQYRWQAQNPYYLLRCRVVEPCQLAGRAINWSSVLYAESPMEADVVVA